MHNEIIIIGKEEKYCTGRGYSRVDNYCKRPTVHCGELKQFEG